MAVVRLYEPNDWAGFANVRSQAYRGGAPVRPDEQLLHDDTFAVVAEVDSQIVGALTVLRHTCSSPKGDLPTGAIAAVGVIPEFRQSGMGSELMRGALDIIRDAGMEMASLYPFSGRWYRRFGFEWVGRRWRIECPSDKLPGIAPSMPVHRVEASDWQRLVPVESAMAEKYHGYNRRTERMWWRSLGGDTPLQIYAVGDPIEAYFTIRLQTDFFKKQEVKEFAWATERGYLALLGFFRSLCLNQNTISWPEPDDSIFLTRFFEQGCEGKLDHPWMMRTLGDDEDPGRKAQALLGPGAYLADFF